MAQVFHFDCKPNVDSSAYRTMNTRYDGTCQGCNKPYAKEDKIAYFASPPAAGSPPSGKDHSPEIKELRQTIIELKAKVHRLEQIEANQSGYIAFLANVDWRKIPKLESPEPKPIKPATPKQAETILKGKDVSTEVVAVQTEIVEDAY